MAMLKSDEVSPNSTPWESLSIYQSYRRSPYLSIKHSSYFQVYEELLAPYRDQAITFVEVGVLNGGSLFMGRDYFGPKARIIGVDLNPGAKKWEADGFEIFIGSQSDPQFWASFFQTVGPIDILLDDGGHTNDQQIITTDCALPNVRNGGLVIIEDTHASYMRSFGNPSPYSFMEYVNFLSAQIHTRFPALRNLADSKEPVSIASQCIYAITAYESIVAFRVDRTRCFISTPTSNEGISQAASDYRYEDSAMGGVFRLQRYLMERLAFLNQYPKLRKAAKSVFTLPFVWHAKFKSRQLKRYFRK